LNGEFTSPDTSSSIGLKYKVGELVFSIPIGGIGKTNTEVTGGSMKIHGDTINSEVESSSSSLGSRGTPDSKGVTPLNSAVKGLRILITFRIPESTSEHGTNVGVVVARERDDSH